MTGELLRAVTDVIMHTVAGQLGELRGEKPPAEFYDMAAHRPPPKKESA